MFINSYLVSIYRTGSPPHTCTKQSLIGPQLPEVEDVTQARSTDSAEITDRWNRTKNDGPSVVITESIPGPERQLTSGGLDRASVGPASPITLLLLPRMFVPSLTFRPTLGARLGSASKRKRRAKSKPRPCFRRRGASYSLVLAAIVKPWAVQPCAHVAICDQSRRAPPCGYPKARCPEADSVPGCPRCGQYAPYTRGLYRKRGGVKFCGLLLAQICAAQQLCFRLYFVSVYSCLLT